MPGGGLHRPGEGHAPELGRGARGAVGIAGEQTGVYPIETPGGWQIIGRTSTLMFDPDRNPASLLAAGEGVRFVPQ